MKSRFTEEQIIKILAEGQAGMKVKDLCRQHGISKPHVIGVYEILSRKFVVKIIPKIDEKF